MGSALTFPGGPLDLGRPRIMGVLNVTPDSFSDGGRFHDRDAAVGQARALVEAVREDGRVFLSSTTLDGRFVIRMAALAFRTHVETVDLALEILCEKARELEETGLPAA